MIEIRWHGRGGQGSFTASRLLGEAVSIYGDQYAMAFPSFGPERRGAPVLAFTKIDTEKIKDRSEVKKCDYIVILDETLFSETFFDDLKPGGTIILNTSNPEKYNTTSERKLVLIDASKLAMEVLGRPITNTAMIGALAGVSGIIEAEPLFSVLGNYFKGALQEKNREVIKLAYESSLKKNQQ